MLTILADASSNWIGNSVPVLHGETGEGYVTLLNCSFAGFRMVGGGQTIQLAIENAILGVHQAQHERWLRRVETELPALAPLLGKDPVKVSNRLGERSRRAQLTLDRRQLTWRDGTTEMTLEYKITAAHDDTSVQLAMTPTMTLTDSSAQSIEAWIEDWIAPANLLIELLTGVKSNPRAIRSWPKKKPSAYERLVSEISVVRRGVGDHEADMSHVALIGSGSVLGSNPLGIRDVMARVSTIVSDHAVFAALLADAVNYPDRPDHNRYLDLVAGLEAFDSVLNGIGPVDEVSYKATRRRVVADAAAAGMPVADVRFLKEWIAPRSSFSLEKRLRRLGRRVAVVGEWKVSATDMANLRNAIAHGSLRVESEKFPDAFRQAFDLARRLVLHEAGLVV